MTFLLKKTAWLNYLLYDGLSITVKLTGRSSLKSYRWKMIFFTTLIIKKLFFIKNYILFNLAG